METPEWSDIPIETSSHKEEIESSKSIPINGIILLPQNTYFNQGIGKDFFSRISYLRLRSVIPNAGFIKMIPSTCFNQIWGCFFCTNVSRKTWVCYELKFQDPSQFQRRTQWIILTKPSCAQPQWLVFLRVSTDVSHLWSPGPSNESTVEERLRGRFLSGFQTVISWNMERLSSGRGIV